MQEDFIGKTVRKTKEKTRSVNAESAFGQREPKKKNQGVENLKHVFNDDADETLNRLMFSFEIRPHLQTLVQH